MLTMHIDTQIIYHLSLVSSLMLLVSSLLHNIFGPISNDEQDQSEWMYFFYRITTKRSSSYHDLIFQHRVNGSLTLPTN